MSRSRSLFLILIVMMIAVLSVTFVACNINTDKVCEHDYSYDVKQLPTMDAEGSLTLTCSKCDLNEEVVIPSLSDLSTWTWKVESTQSANCEQGGTVTYTSVRPYADIVVEIKTEAKGHILSELIPEVPSTCMTNGVAAHKECSVCGKLFDEDENLIESLELPLADHKLGALIPEVPSTCISHGVVAHKECSECGKLFDADGKAIDSLELPLADHKLSELIAEVPASCTSAGVKAHYSCEKCGITLDADKKVITDLTIPALSHEYDEGTVIANATCYSKGIKEFKCKHCDSYYFEYLPEVDHTSIKVEGYDATCTTDGLTDGAICSECGEELKKQEVIEATGHHHELSEIIDATCISVGYEYYTCSCGDMYFKTIEKIAHTPEELEGYAPSCLEDGLTDGKYCSYCGEILEKQNTIPASGHSWDNGVIDEEATCTEVGSKLYTCENCGDTKAEEIKAKGHTPVVLEGIEATCTTVGLTEGSQCSECGEILVAQKGVSALGHDWDEGTETVSPDCTHKGENLHECSRCEATKIEYVKANGHSYSDEWSFDKSYHFHKCDNCDAVADRAGHTDTNKDHKCDICGYAMSSCVDRDKNHECDYCGASMGNHIQAAGKHTCDYCGKVMSSHVGGTATCKEPATCTVCGQKYGSKDVNNHVGHLVWVTDDAYHQQKYDCCGLHIGSKEEHTLNENDVCIICGHGCNHSHTVHTEGLAPTCTEEGHIEYWTCDHCSTIFSDEACTQPVANVVIPAKGHSYGLLVSPKAPNCTEAGYVAYYHCSECKLYFNDKHEVKAWSDLEIKALGHDTVDYDAKAETCESIGWNAYETCSRCDYTTYQEIPAKGHNYGDWIAEVPATCTVDGTVGHYHCSNCNKDFNSNKVLITNLILTKLGHTPADAVVENKKDSTCIEVGHYDSVVYCSICGDELSRIENIEIAKKAHEFGKWIDEVPSTCVATGIKGHKDCSLCHKHYDNKGDEITDLTLTINSDAHNWSDDWTGVEEGHYHLCINEGCDKNDTLVPHTEGTPATCSTKATCSVCSQPYGAFDATKHAWSSSYFYDANKHYQECSNCDAKGNESAHADADEDGLCDACNVDITIVAVFQFGANSVANHKDGSIFDNNKYSETNNEFTLYLTDGVNAYKNAFDAQGNSALKLGTSKNAGSFKLAVPEGITKVVFYVAKYKDNNTRISINGTEYTVPTGSNNGAYTAYVIDTTTVETITFKTESGGLRCMIDKIEFYSNAQSGGECEHEGGTATCKDKAICTKCGQPYGELADHTYGDWIAEVPATCVDSGTLGHYHCSVCEKDFAENGTELTSLVKEATGDHNYVNGTCKDCGKSESSPTTVTVVIKDYAQSKGWNNGELHSSIEMNSLITVVATGTQNTGKFYTDGNNWRIYQTEDPSVTISAKNGYTIISVKITYTSYNNGVLTLNGANVSSKTVVEVKGSSVTFGVGNTGTATNGQARITAIEVVYENGASSHSHSFTDGYCECGEMDPNYTFSVNISDLQGESKYLDHNVKFTGTVVKINTPYDSQYKNITVTLADDNGKQIYVYRLKANVALCDVITVEGKYILYNNTTYEIDTGATATIIGKNHTGGTADCQNKAICTICGEEYGELGSHKWATEYSHNDTHHWYECTVSGCTEKNGNAEHDFSNGDCICGVEDSSSSVTLEGIWGTKDGEIVLEFAEGKFYYYTNYGYAEEYFEKSGSIEYDLSLKEDIYSFTYAHGHTVSFIIDLENEEISLEDALCSDDLITLYYGETGESGGQGGGDETNYGDEATFTESQQGTYKGSYTEWGEFVFVISQSSVQYTHESMGYEDSYTAYVSNNVYTIVLATGSDSEIVQFTFGDNSISVKYIDCWNSEYTATATKEGSSSHTCVYDQEVVDAKYLKSVATCTANATYYKSCSCGLSSQGTEHEATFTSGEKNSSNHTENAVWSIKNASEHKKTYTCCDAVVVELSAHTWSNGVCTECSYECTHEVETSSAPITKVDSSVFDAGTIVKDAIFSYAVDINKFNRVQNEGNRSYIVNLVHDNSYLYVYIQSTVEAGNDADRLSFYIVKKDSDKTTLIETYPNKGEISKGGDACVSIKVGKIDGGYALKAKIDLSTLAISANNEIGFGVRFVNSDNTVFLSVGSTADDGSHTKVENANNLSYLRLSDYVAKPVEPVAPTPDSNTIVKVETADYDNSNLNKDAMFDSAVDITSFNRVQGNNDYNYVLNLVHDNEYLYVYIHFEDSAPNQAERLSFYIVKKNENRTTFIETRPNDDNKYTAGKDSCVAINVGNVENGYTLKAKIELSTLAISANNEIGFGVRLINNNSDDIHLSVGSVADSGNGTKVENANNLPKLVLSDYVAPIDETTTIVYVSNASYDNSNLNKDAMFDSAANITSFNRVQGNTDHSYTINLVHDNTNLYVYIFSADSNRNDNDRISFYIGKNGASETTLVETKPNKDDPYTAGKDACDEINVGKVDGGYVLKAKIALSSLEISADGKVGFCVRLINNDNADIHLSLGAKPNDGDGSTKVKLVSNLAQLTLVDYSASAPQQATVRFLVDGEVYDTVTGNIGTAIVVPEVAPTKTGFRFVHWEGITKDSVITENTDIYAVFIPCNATCTDKAICPICGGEYGELNSSNHTGTVSEEWKHDETSHWHEYSCCNAIVDKADHTPNHEGHATEEYAITCTECGYEIEPIVTHEHTFGSWEKGKEATCTEDGNVGYYYCSGCKKYYDSDKTTVIDNVVLTKLGHTKDHHEAVDAEYKKAGNKEYWSCKNCDKYFSDADCTKEINDKDSVIIAALERIYFTNTPGWETIYAHTFQEGTENATTWPGVAMTKDEDSDNYYVDVDPTHDKVVFNNGSIQTGNLKLDAEENYNPFKAIHYYNESNWENVYVHHWIDEGFSSTWNTCPKMDADGSDGWYTIYIWEDCQKVIFKNDAGDATEKTADLEIDWENPYYLHGTWVNEKAPKVTVKVNDDVVTEYTLSYQNEGGALQYNVKGLSLSVGDTVVITDFRNTTYSYTEGNFSGTATRSGSHDFYVKNADSKIWVTVPNFCYTVNGNVTEFTANPNKENEVVATVTLNKGDELVVSDNENNSYVLENSGFLTANNKLIHSGSYTLYLKLDTKNIWVNYPHNYGTKIEAKEATCTESGNSAYYYCEDCGKYFNESFTETSFSELTISAKGHNAVPTVKKDATCTEDGYEAYWTCSVCSKKYSDVDCMTELENIVVIPAFGHNFTAETVHADYLKSEANCQSAAIYYKSCANCGLSSVGVAGKEATFTNGEKDSSNHSSEEKEWVAIDGTKHKQVWKCCGATIIEESHEIGEDGICTKCKEGCAHSRIIHYEAKSATCTEDGNVEYWTCTDCKKNFSDEECTQEITLADTVIEKVEHTTNEENTYTASEPTCKNDGNIAYYYCTVCEKYYATEDNNEVSLEEVRIPATDLHVDNDENGKCDICGEDLSTPSVSYANYSYEFTETTIKKTGEVKLGEVSWTVSTDGGYWGYDGNKGQQIGSKNDPAEKFKLSTTGLVNFNKIVINASTASDATATLNVYVGETEVLSKSLTSSATYYPIELGALSSDSITIEISQQTTSKAIYIKSIVVTGSAVEEHTHTGTKTEATSATCTEEGNIAYWTCSCGKIFNDEDCTQEITLADTVIEKVEHTTNEENTYTASEPTCKNDGNIAYYYCTVCEKYYATEDNNEVSLEEVRIPATDLHVDNDENGKCDTCGDDMTTSNTKLDAPVLSIGTDGKVTWTAVTNATGYKYQVKDKDGEYSTEADATSGSITLTNGQTIKVWAVGNGSSLLDSDPVEKKCVAIWKLQTDTGNIKVRSQIIIAANNSDVALSTTQNGNNRGQVSITKSNDTVTFGDDVQIITIEEGKKDNTFAFNVGKGYLYAASSNSNYLRTETELTNNSSWNISINYYGVATIKAQGSNTRNTLRYNKDSSLFSCYASGQQDVVIYLLSYSLSDPS